MRNAILRVCPLLALAAALPAQNPPLLENDQVRVIKALDRPHVKGKPHEHKLNRVMIYLDAGKQEITPVGGKPTVLEYKAGDVKWSPASGMHVSEVVSDQPVNMIELEVKRPGTGKKVDVALDPVKVAPKIYHVEFENDQVRVVRVKIPAHGKIPLHEHVLNRVVCYLTDQNGSMTTPDGKTETAQHKAGEVSWGGPVKHSEENLMDKPFEGIVVEFKD